MASRARGEGPSGFSLLASLTMSVPARPYSRSTSSMGLPGTYGRRRLTCGGTGGGGCIADSPCFLNCSISVHWRPFAAAGILPVKRREATHQREQVAHVEGLGHVTVRAAVGGR